MKYFFGLTLCLITSISFAQHERDNWLMGKKLGMQFSNGAMSVIPQNTSAITSRRGASSYSDPVTGELIFYTNGSIVYNKNHKQMPNGFDINNYNNSGLSDHSVIIPFPRSTNLFYIVSAAGDAPQLYYSIVDMNLEGGMGDVVEKARLIKNDASESFCVVKQRYEDGFWLITHSIKSNKFESFRINSDGINMSPIISIAGGVPNKPHSWFDNMISNSSGDRFVYSFSSLDNVPTSEEFLFDKGCGKIVFNQSFLLEIDEDSIVSPLTRKVYTAYSSDDSKLYALRPFVDGHYIFQYNLKDNNPGVSRITISKHISEGDDMQLGPDGKIYVGSSTKWQNSSPLMVSVIQNPDKLGLDCMYEFEKIKLGDSVGSRVDVEFPEFIMDVSPEFEGPEIEIEHSCENLDVSLSLLNEIVVDSFYWDLGDDSTANTLGVLHRYSSEGDYIISFNWYLCGVKRVVRDTLLLRSNPVFELGNDTNLCSGQKLRIHGPPRLETYEYLWNVGGNSFSKEVSEAGTYSLKVVNGKCETQDEITVTYSDKLWTTLGDEYFICDDHKELVKLDAGGDFAQYKWTPTGDTSQWIIVGNVADYFVVVKDFRGCDGSDHTKVKRSCPVNVFYPNAFTPNADGKNDLYLPVGSDVVEFSLTIYNAWGQQVFKTKNFLEGWDGMVNGKPSPDGTYIYQSSYSGYRNKQLVSFEVKGNLTLLR